NPLWRIRIEGLERVTNPRNPYVVVSNHQSMADIPIISRLPWDMKWVAKASLFKLPVVKTMMRVAGDIPVDRGDKDSRGKVYGLAESYLKRRCSVMFFAEGTRAKDDKVLAFHDGAFKLAIQAQVPVLPLAVDGSRDCLPKHTWIFRNVSNIHLAVLDPVPTTGMTEDQVELLRETVRNRVMDQLAHWRGVARHEVDSLATVATFGEPGPMSERWAELLTSLRELHAYTADAMSHMPHFATDVSEKLAELQHRVSEAMARVPHMAAETVEELHRKIGEIREALAEFQQHTADALHETPQRLSRAIQELSELIASPPDAPVPA
ncbi:MAG: 1-acyl-sn-glycerol-3-phosphate acyltransferase, partial [Deltaproteobacteria bacterium]|nr:1-acyl-sn-glycerol-3-phosphate acyltransferase [Deltaproteobacteria bacterium]